MFNYTNNQTLVDFIMKGIPAKGCTHVSYDIVTGKPYEECVTFYKKHMLFKGIPCNIGEREVPAFKFCVLGCNSVDGYFTLDEIREQYPGVYKIMMEPEREPSFAPCVEGDYDDPGLVIFA